LWVNILDVGAVPHSTDKSKTETEQKQNANIFYNVSVLFYSVHIQWTDAVE